MSHGIFDLRQFYGWQYNVTVYKRLRTKCRKCIEENLKVT